MSRSVRVVGPVVGAWLVALLGFMVLRRGSPLSDLQPSLPLVSLPFNAHRDVASSVPMLFAILAFALACALIVEPAKLAVCEQAHLRRIGYVLLLVFQVSLVADVFRAYAYDWWRWTTTWLGFSQLREVIDLKDVAGLRIPWPSGVMAVCLAAYLAGSARFSRTETGAKG